MKTYDAESLGEYIKKRQRQLVNAAKRLQNSGYGLRLAELQRLTRWLERNAEEEEDVEHDKG